MVIKMIYEDQYYKISESDLRLLLECEKECLANAFDDPESWEKAKKYNIKERLSNFEKLPSNNLKVVKITKL